jgi:CubicO group peptidase (beta-lactamase class C family)
VTGTSEAAGATAIDDAATATGTTGTGTTATAADDAEIAASGGASASGRPLPRSTPASQGVDSRRIAAFLDALEAEPGIAPHSLMVLRHGKVVAQGWWAPYTADRRHLLYSLSKSFTATAAAFASAEGLLRLDDTAVSHFPEFEAEITDPGSRSILVRHLLSMASGHSREQWGEAVRRDPSEPVRGFLLGGPDGEPGKVFAYNQPCTYTVAAIVQRASGQSLVDYLRPRLFEPLGIDEVAWQQHPAGRDIAFTGMHATTDAVAKLGQLYLQRGVWEGVRLLSEEWVEQATRSQVDNSDAGGSSDWGQGYGFQFWISRHGYRGDGAFGQFCLVLPEQDAVVAITSETIDMDVLLELAWKHLLPAFDEGQAADAEAAARADAALTRRLTELALTPCSGRTTPRATAESVGQDGLVCTASGEGPVSQVHLKQCSDDTDDWILTVTEDLDSAPAFGAGYEDFPHGPITLRLAPGDGWRVSGPGELPTAVSGGWVDTDRLRFDVLFLETPHSLEVTCDLANRTVGSSFRTTPIRPSSLTSLRAPRIP